MNLVRNFFSSIIGSLLVFVIGALIVLFSITLVLFDQNFVLGTLAKNDTYHKFATEVVPKFLVVATTQRYQTEATDQSLSESLSERIDTSAFGNLEPDLKSIVENSYSFVLGEKDGFEVQIELRNYLPSLQQNIDNALSSLQSEGKFQGISLEEIGEGVEGAENASLRITQDNIEVIGLNELNTETQVSNKEDSPLRNFREIIGKIRETQTLLIVISIILVVILFLTRLPHFLSGFKWIASTAVSASLLPLVLGFLLLLFKPVDLITRFIKEQESVATFSTAVDVISKNLLDITNKIFMDIVLISGAILIFGIFSYLLVFFLSKKSKPAQN